MSARILWITLQLTCTDDGTTGKIKAKMSNNGPLKDQENFKPGMSRKSELGEALRVLKESLEYDEEQTVTPSDMDMELDYDKIVERDVHVVEMNAQLREKLSNRINTIESVVDKDFQELMEKLQFNSKKKMVGDYTRLMEEENHEVVMIQKLENEDGIGFISLTLDDNGEPIPRAMPEWMLNATLTRDNRLIR